MQGIRPERLKERGFGKAVFTILTSESQRWQTNRYYFTSPRKSVRRALKTDFLSGPPF